MSVTSDEARERPGPRQALGSAARPGGAGAPLLRLEAHLLVARKWYQMHRVEHVLDHPRSNTSERTVVHDRREHDAVDRDLLDAMEQRLTFRVITLARLLVKEVVEVRIASVGVAALGVHERFHAAGGVTRVAHRGHEQAAKLLLTPGGEERRALHEPHLR